MRDRGDLIPEADPDALADALLAALQGVQWVRCHSCAEAGPYRGCGRAVRFALGLGLEARQEILGAIEPGIAFQYFGLEIVCPVVQVPADDLGCGRPGQQVPPPGPWTRPPAATYAG